MLRSSGAATVVCLAFVAATAASATDLADLVAAHDFAGFQRALKGTPYRAEEDVRGLFRFFSSHQGALRSAERKAPFLNEAYRLLHDVAEYQTKEIPNVLSADRDILVLLHEHEPYAGGQLDLFTGRQFSQLKDWFGVNNVTIRKPSRVRANDAKRQFLSDVRRVVQSNNPTTVWLNAHGSGASLALTKRLTVSVSYEELAAEVMRPGQALVDMSNTIWIFETCYSGDFAWRFVNELARLSRDRRVAFEPPPLVIADTARDSLSYGFQRAILQVQISKARDFKQQGYLSLADCKPIAKRMANRKNGSQQPVFILPVGGYRARLRDLVGDSAYNPFVQISLKYVPE